MGRPILLKRKKIFFRKSDDDLDILHGNISIRGRIFDFLAHKNSKERSLDEPKTH